MSEFYVIGVTGYCKPTKFDKEQAWELLANALDDMAKHGKGKKILVLGGLTDIPSIHQLSYYIARQRGWNVGGIACNEAIKYKWFPMNNYGDMLKFVGKTWGDESDEFIKRCDAFVRIGGGKQSHVEAELARVKGIPMKEIEIK